jgi:protein-disulfide isomerase
MYQWDLQNAYIGITGNRHCCKRMYVELKKIFIHTKAVRGVYVYTAT